MPNTALINTIADSWCRRNRPESMNTDWGQSLLAAGLLSAVRTTGNSAAHEYLRRWLTYHLGSGIHPNYFVGSWSIGLLYPEVITVFPEFRHQLLGVAENVYEFILRKAIRNGAGVILHNVDLPHVYIDTIYYTAPVLARLGTALGRDDWRDEAVHQLNAHLEILRDPDTGFWIHCQENRSGRRSQGAWARGNGWVAMTCAELLPHFRRTSSGGRVIQTVLKDLLASLLPLQTRAGLWKTILNDKSAYGETSATAMFLSAMKRARHLGDFDSAIGRAERGLQRFVDPDGRLLGCSEGTWPGDTAYYLSLPRGEWWWGTGAYLLSLTA